MEESKINIEIKYQKENFKNKRLASIDYGLKRTGIAVCDELHITVSPRIVLDPAENDFWVKLNNFTENEKISAFVVGMPVRHDEKKTELIEKIDNFVFDLKEKCGLPVFTYDESFSTKKAVSVLLEIGAKKKRRATKGTNDLIAAAIILKEFLNENDN